ncbi:MAG: hypothetical protein ABI210_07285 [Abditibacteriaceae bacterium]
MNLFLRKLKTSFYIVALLPCVVLTFAFAQTTPSQSPAMSTSSDTDVNHLIDNPTLITLHFEDTPMRTVMEELAKQAGIVLNYVPQKTLDLENRTISIDIDHQPFWMAVRTVSIASKINLSITNWNNQPYWVYTRDANLDSPYYVSKGPFLIVADSITIQSNISTTFPFGRKSIRTEFPNGQFWVRSYIDPKLSLTGISNIEPEQIIDEKGHSLIPKTYSPFSPAYQSIDSYYSSSTSLDLSHDYGKRIAVFKGNLRFLQLKKSFTWEVPDILNARGITKTITCNGIPVLFVINDIKQTDNGYKVQMTLSWNQPSSPNQSNYDFGNQLQLIIDMVARSMHLIDVKGNAFSRGGYSSRGGNNSTVVNASFRKSRADATAKNTPYIQMGIPNPYAQDASGVPAKLVIKVPTELAEIKVPFEFTNLPLPKVN